jgi:hypothetical protein
MGKRWWLGIVAAAVLAGCTSPEEPLAVVHGTVRYLGAPLPGGTIVFTPDPTRGGSGESARAEIKADGTYILYTGAEPGVARRSRLAPRHGRRRAAAWSAASRFSVRRAPFAAADQIP